MSRAAHYKLMGDILDSMGDVSELEAVRALLELSHDFIKHMAYQAKKAEVFVNHIQNHLDYDQVVICKICDKDIDQIWDEEK